MLDYKIKFKPFPNGQIIRKYTNNEMYGYLVLESDEPHLDPMITDLYLNFIDGDKSKLPKREAILRSKTDLLIKFVDKFKTEVIPGRIKISEYLENEITEEVKLKFLRQNIQYKESIFPFIKKYHYKTKFNIKENDAFIILKNNGQKILQFIEYSPNYQEDIIIDKYDIEVTQKLINLFCESLHQEQETEKKNKTVEQRFMTTYVNIGTFLKNENTIIKFFASSSNGIDPFNFIVPSSTNVLTGFLLGERGIPKILKFVDTESTINFIDNLKNQILKVFILYYSQNNFLPFLLHEVIESNERLLGNIWWRNSAGEEYEDFWHVLLLFFENNDYQEFKQFVDGFENFVKTKCWSHGILNKLNEFLLCELMLKDVTRTYFIIENELLEKVNLVFNDYTYTQSLCNQDPKYFNNTQLINFILMQKNDKPISIIHAISNSTHIEIIENQFHNFTFEFRIFWTASRTNKINSNISNENILESCIQINLKNILRYSENYIEAQKHGSFINFNELIENLVITLPESGFSPMFITKNEKWVDPEKQKFIINDNFKRLANNVKISDSYFNYCKYLISLLKYCNYEDLYNDDIIVKIPIWEISRIQHLNLEKYYRLEYIEGEWEEQKYEDWIAMGMPTKDDWDQIRDDGLDDFNQIDPDWIWNID